MPLSLSKEADPAPSLEPFSWNYWQVEELRRLTTLAK